MPTFKEMDPEVALRIVEGYEDVLTPALEEREALYSRFSCPRCRCSLQKELDVRTCFDGDIPVTKYLLRCPSCAYLIDPYTHMVIEFGDASKIPVESSVLIVPDQYE